MKRELTYFPNFAGQDRGIVQVNTPLNISEDADDAKIKARMHQIQRVLSNLH
jgi:hypothetical protein